MKRSYWLILLFFLFGSTAEAFEETVVKGSVVNEDGDPMDRVTITVRDIRTGDIRNVVTDNEGVFVIKNLVADQKYDFTFSYVGYETGQIKSFHVSAGDNNSLLYRMKKANVELSEGVVVTALGIKREERSLGYSAQSLKENVVKDARTNNWVNSLNGKVPGLNIQSAGTGPIGSSRITLRGESSLNLDNNQALVVVDGVPVSQRNTGINAGNNDMGVDFGSSVSDINPDDIENITVLKGPGATALYGSRAAGGALIITTKSGRQKSKGMGITLNSNVSMETVNRWPDYQFEYGEGRTDKYYSYGDSEDGPNTSKGAAAGRGWGPKFNGQLYYQYDPNTPDHQTTERVPWVANKNYIKDFFRTGITYSNSVAIDATSDKGSARLAVTHLKNSFILPNAGFERINAALSVNHAVNDKFRISGKLNYTNKLSDNLPIAGYNNHTSMYFFILGTAPNIQADWFKPYWEPGYEHIRQYKPFNPGPENPYVTFYEMLNTLNKNGVIGNISANYNITDRLELMVRSGLDLSQEFRTERFPFGMTSYPRGRYREQNVFFYEMNTDALLSYNGNVGKDWKYKVSIGANAMKQLYNFAGMYADNLSQPGIYQISNSLDQPVADPQRSEKAIHSVYTFGQLAWREKIYVDITGRNDWSSTLPVQNNSFFYPSVSASFLISEMLQMPAAISFAKFRLSWAQVGNDAVPYQTSKYYNLSLSKSFTNPSTLYNQNLKPEIRSSLEAGIDIRFLQGRIGVDVTVYDQNSRNQILGAPIDGASGYSSTLLNAGLINSKGVEVALTGKPVSNNNFSWNTTITWSRNRSYVKELADGVTNHVLYSYIDRLTIQARVGGRMGDMYGRGFQRSPDGKIIYTSDGLPAALDQNVKKLGNAFADWKAGLLNEFRFRNIQFSFLLDGQMGGSMFSHTNHKLNTLGKTTVTLPGRDGGIVGDGVVYNAASDKYEPNNKNVSAMSYYEKYYELDNMESNTFDASYLKLREARVAVNLPAGLVNKLKMQQLSIAIYGRELFNITNFPAFDPDGGTLNNGSLRPGLEITQYPTTRSIGLNLTARF